MENIAQGDLPGLGDIVDMKIKEREINDDSNVRSWETGKSEPGEG